MTCALFNDVITNSLPVPLLVPAVTVVLAEPVALFEVDELLLADVLGVVVDVAEDADEDDDDDGGGGGDAVGGTVTSNTNRLDASSYVKTTPSKVSLRLVTTRTVAPGVIILP